MRLNSDKVHKPATSVAPGDVLTFAQGRRIRVIKVLGLPTRRGPAPEAEGFYEDLSPPEDAVPKNPGFEGKGRPTGKDRRAIRSFRRSPLE